MDHDRPGDPDDTIQYRQARSHGGGTRRVAFGLLGALVVAAVAAPSWFYWRLRGSLPALDGEAAVAGLQAPTTVERDALGVPTIRGASRLDVARATGFVHGQDRFFQMDLLRRRAAGELAQLVGRAAVGWDRRIRVHRLRRVAQRSLVNATPSERGLLEAYAAGVNEGVAALRDKPFEYILLRAEPAPWRAEDTVLVLLSMFIDLTSWDGHHESDMGVLHDLLPPPMFDFLAAEGTEWDTPDEGAPFTTPPLPGPEVFDLRRAAPTTPSTALRNTTADEAEVRGSNGFAVASGRSARGCAILASDMHLGLAVPNIWYRAALTWPDPERPGHDVRVVGVTLPGTPAVVVGSNTRVAWGFTNSEGDWSDLVVVETDPGDREVYLAPDGRHRFEHAFETIDVKGAASQKLEVVSTIWGPVVDLDHDGRPRALRWTAHEAAAVNLNLLGLEGARTLEEALAVANTSGIPPQNFVCTSSDGRIGWTIAGVLPRRVGFDGRLPTSWRDGTRRSDSWLSAPEIPRIVDPPSGLLWTANARVVGGDALAKIGDGGYALGARARQRQIRDDLAARERAGEEDLLAIQLDDRAVFLTRWRGLMLAVLTPPAVAADPRRAEVQQLVEGWGGRAAVESAGYRLVRSYRDLLVQWVMESLTAACRRADGRFRYGSLPQAEGPVWRILTERPTHLLAPQFASWDDQLLATADAVAAQMRSLGGDLAEHTWGKRNSAAIRHPLSLAVPLLGPLLNMPHDELPGDANMPRVQSPSFGASERTVVSPGEEGRGIFHMPCGQSGHPLSQFYRAGHRAWVLGSPTSFLPGPRSHLLTLVPPGATNGRR